MKNAVVTGATGFIGGALAKYLVEQGYHVIAVGRNTTQLEALSAEMEVVQADFSKYAVLHQSIKHADVFYHLAWEGAYGTVTSDYTLQLKNVIATGDAFKSAVLMGCKKFVFAGTIAELEVREHLDSNICAPRGTCIYAAAKLNAEMLCKTFAAAHGIAFNAGLFANIIGPGDRSHRSTNFILNKFLHNEAPKLVAGNGLNDWLYIKDAVRLIEAMGEYGVSGKTYYIGHENLWTLKRIISRARDIVAPDLMLHFGEMPDAFLTDYKYISTTDLHDDTGVKANYSFTQAIRETADWVRTLNF